MPPQLHAEKRRIDKPSLSWVLIRNILIGVRLTQGDELGRGGMAVVYQATDPTTGAEVALKRPLPWDGCSERLAREILVLSALTSPHLMPILESGVDEDGEPWYSMPLAEGNLKALYVQGALTPKMDELCLEVLHHSSSGLAAMHAENYVHRDFNPRNLLRLSGTRWVVSDCGLTRRPDGDTTMGLTGSASALGTMGYIAPEVHGDPHNATPAADVYSLGRVLAWLTTGRNPIATQQLLPSGKWRAPIRLLTNSDPERRPQSAADARDQVLELLAEPPFSERETFRQSLKAMGNLPRPSDSSWDFAVDSIADENFMLDDLVMVETQAVRGLARARPEVAAQLAEQLAFHLEKADWSMRSFDYANKVLDWVLAVMSTLEDQGLPDLLEDVARPYCIAVAHWNRYSHNDTFRRWIREVRGASAESLVRAIHGSSEVGFFKQLVGSGRIADPGLASLLRD